MKNVILTLLFSLMKYYSMFQTFCLHSENTVTPNY